MLFLLCPLLGCTSPITFLFAIYTTADNTCFKMCVFVFAEYIHENNALSHRYYKYLTDKLIYEDILRIYDRIREIFLPQSKLEILTLDLPTSPISLHFSWYLSAMWPLRHYWNILVCLDIFWGQYLAERGRHIGVLIPKANGPPHTNCLHTY